MRLLIGAVLTCCCGASAVAERKLFDVHLSGTSEQGNHLTVSGQLSIDPTLAIDGSNIGGSSLFVQRNSETPARPLSFLTLAIPNDTLGTVQMAWSLVGKQLYITRLSEEDSTITYVGLSLSSPQLPNASLSLSSGTNTHALTYGNASGIETAVLKSASGPDGPQGFLVGTLAPEPAAPFCDIETTQPSYVNTEVTGLSKLRFANLGGTDLVSRLIIELKYDAAEFTATAFDVGADSSIVLPASFDVDYGPQPIIAVQTVFPRGTWRYRCAIVDPISGAVYAEDYAKFQLQ